MSFGQIPKMLLAGPGALALCSCGGGGGGMSFIPPSPTSTSTPTPTPAPTPTPTAILVFPDVTTSTAFATVGYESPGRPIQPAALVQDGFSVFFDERSNAYFMDVPSTRLGILEATTTGERYWNGEIAELSFGGPETSSLNVFRPGPQNFDLALTYTSFAEYTTPGGPFGVVAFGSATPASAVPVTGGATYHAFAAGFADQFSVRGNVSLQFDFAAGTLSGSFEPFIYDLLSGHTPLGHFDFANTVYGVGSTSFSGELSTSSTSARGSFSGQFTGPRAEELMARWTAPLHDPSTDTDTQMFGVWVGKK